MWARMPGRAIRPKNTAVDHTEGPRQREYAGDQWLSARRTTGASLPSSVRRRFPVPGAATGGLSGKTYFLGAVIAIPRNLARLQGGFHTHKQRGT